MFNPNQEIILQKKERTVKNSSLFHSPENKQDKRLEAWAPPREKPFLGKG